MLNSFIIVLREGFESFLLVAVILSFLRKAGHKWLTSSVYVAILLALATSAGLGYLLKTGVNDYLLIDTLGPTIGGSISQFFNNEALREAILGSTHGRIHGPVPGRGARRRLPRCPLRRAAGAPGDVTGYPSLSSPNSSAWPPSRTPPTRSTRRYRARCA